MNRAPAALAACVITAFASPAAADSEFVLRAGVPQYLSFYGRSADRDTTSASAVAHLGTDMTFTLLPVLQFGPSLDGGYVSGEVDGVGGFIYSVAVGPLAQFHSRPWTGQGFVIGLGLRPALLFYGAVADQDTKKHSITLGGSARLSLRFRVTRSISLGGSAELGIYAAPLTDRLWLGERLGATSVANFDLGLTLLF